MRLRQLLREHQRDILERWFEDTLATYPEKAAAAFRRQKDPFANPVGHSLRVGTRGVFEILIEGWDETEIRESLLEIIRIRAVQEISPAGAVGFVFGLKQAIRAELGEAVDNAPLSSELAEIEDQIDRIALCAFDLYVECRENVYKLRIDEVKRQVSWVVDKMNERDPDPTQPPLDSGGGV